MYILKYFGMTRPGFELTIYGIRGENAKHCTTDAVYATDACER